MDGISQELAITIGQSDNGLDLVLFCMENTIDLDSRFGIHKVL